MTADAPRISTGPGTWRALGFTPTGSSEATQPILKLAKASGPWMDYEVCLLSRVREEWDRTGDNPAVVATGLARTGPILTSAPLLLIVIGAFATSGITFIKMPGFGMVIAMAVDATVVRDCSCRRPCACWGPRTGGRPLRCGGPGSGSGSARRMARARATIEAACPSVISTPGPV